MCVVLGIVVVLMLANWTLYARGEYGGPKVVLLENSRAPTSQTKSNI